jgi:NADH-quinone oxidoreductase subunit F
VDLLNDIEQGRGEAGDLDVLTRNAELIGAPGNTFCLHATGAMEPLLSALKHFPEDFAEHVRTGRCSYREA